MNLTFNDLVTQMKNSYFSVTGETLSEDSETAKRLEAVASELYSLSCYGDYIFKQAFVQTATGKYLDYHAQLRGVTRKTASSSAGEVTFSVIEPLEEDIIIPVKVAEIIRSISQGVRFFACRNTDVSK